MLWRATVKNSKTGIIHQSRLQHTRLVELAIPKTSDLGHNVEPAQHTTSLVEYALCAARMSNGGLWWSQSTPASYSAMHAVHEHTAMGTRQT